LLLWDGRPARPKRTGGTPIPQTCGSYLILIPKLIESPNNSCEIYGADLEEVAAQSQQPEAALAGVRSQKSGRLGRVHPHIWLIVQIGEPRPTSLIMIPRVIQPH